MNKFQRGIALIKRLIKRRSEFRIQNSGNENRFENNGTIYNLNRSVIGEHNAISIGRNSILVDIKIYIRGSHNTIIIEDDCHISKVELWIENDHCSLIIRKKTTVEEAHLAVTESHSILEIQEDCMLAKNVEIRTGDSHTVIDRSTGSRINFAANVLLRPHVWVGAHVKILKGVTVGNNVVIATGAVVTKDIPPYSIAAGVPAKVVRSNIDWKRERI